MANKYYILQDTFKLFGVLIDRELNFSNNSLHICKYLNKKYAVISQKKSLSSPKFQMILFKTLIISHFEYCSTLYIDQANLNE